MRNLNIPSYNHLQTKEHRVRSIQELYDYIYRWKQEVEATIQKKEPAFSGTYTSTADLDAVTTANDNDYAWVTRVDSDNNTVYDHYRYVAGSGWVYEYTASNPTFSTAEWESIQSTITLDLVNKLIALPTNAELTTSLDAKANKSEMAVEDGTGTDADKTTITLKEGTSATVLKTHQDISNKADSATTLAGYGITDAKIENGVITLGSNTITPLTAHQDISGKANASDLANVATSGDYNDLSNKPTIPTVPTDVSAFNNDAEYLTSHQDISGKANSSDVYTKTAADAKFVESATVRNIITLTQAQYDALTSYDANTLYHIIEP